MKQRAIRIPEIQDKQLSFEEVFKKISLVGVSKKQSKAIGDKFNPSMKKNLKYMNIMTGSER